jgi:hypothetical protein
MDAGADSAFAFFQRARTAQHVIPSEARDLQWSTA